MPRILASAKPTLDVQAARLDPLRVDVEAGSPLAVCAAASAPLRLLVGHEPGQGSALQNLVPNGSFAAYTTSPGAPNAWTAQGPGAGVTVQRETEITRSGNAVRVTVDWTQASMNQVHGAFVTLPALALDYPHYFEASVYLVDALEASESVVAKIRNNTDATDIVSQGSGYPVGQWAKVAGILRTIGTAKTYNVQLGLFRNTGSTPTGSTTVIFDDYWCTPFPFLDIVGGRVAKGTGGTAASNLRGPTPGQPGRLPGELSTLFNGAQQCAIATTPFNFGRQGFEDVPFSLELWRLTTANPTGGDTCLLAVRGHNTGICETTSTPRWQARIPTVSHGTVTVSTPIVLNQWTRLLMTYSGAPLRGIRFYTGRDILIGAATVDPAAQFGATSTALQMGSDGSATRFAFGRQQNCRVYNKELTAEEVAWLGDQWNAGRHPGPYLPGDFYPSCVAEWTLGEAPPA